ncbi:unnamed protein product [Ceutorhynchus assimilis]|uniref:Lipase domain-containing protein n=1 Tax=Ceutorhynchus assimilis TaxID=467358 RepID=A0A9P0GPI7_9CUCU|nr:unnamed protein product [Ceutorhynchus assimilis]
MYPSRDFSHNPLEKSSNTVFFSAYLTTGDYNVILAQNQRLLAGPDYRTAASNCKPIGQFSALFVDYLVLRGLNLKDLHVIGLSLGGQIAGFLGNFVKSGKLPRITALDPAGPLFNLKPVSERLDKSDAEFVDVIHSNAALFGIQYSVGHVDFWPNGGRKQPGCQDGDKVKIYGLRANWLLFCDHYRSYQLYVKSILSPHRFLTTKCNGYLLYKLGFCDQNHETYMGFAADAKYKGNYYINTGLAGIYVGFTEKFHSLNNNLVK